MGVWGGDRFRQKVKAQASVLRMGGARTRAARVGGSHGGLCSEGRGSVVRPLVAGKGVTVRKDQAEGQGQGPELRGGKVGRTSGHT